MITANIVTEPFEAVIGNDFKINVNTITDIEGNPLNLDTTFIEIEWQDLGGIKYLTRHDPRGESENCKIEDGKLQIIFDKTRYRFRYPDVLTYRVHARSYDGDLRDNSFDIWTSTQTSNISLNSGSRKFGCQTALAHVEMPYAPYKGDKGDRGDQGETGIQGARGECGEQGPTGERGEIGERGPYGLQGEQGDQGEKGDQGNVGDQGEHGVKGEQGERGFSGKSSYEIAVTNGYIGTEIQFGKEQVAIAANSTRLAAVEQNKLDKPIAGRTFLTPLFVALGAIFNDSTGFYELNGLTDITENQMMEIYNRSIGLIGGDWSGAFYTSSARTNLKVVQLDSVINSKETFRNTNYIEVIRISAPYSTQELSPKIENGELMFFQSKVKQIINHLDCTRLINSNNMFTRCTNLEFVNLIGLSISISIAESPLLKVECVRDLINNAKNKTPITVTLHPTAKARLTAEDIALAVSKNITVA